jgi:hypothetical protein
MGDLALRTNEADVFAAMDRYVSDLLGKVAPRSANRLIAMADVAGRRKIAEVYGISSRKIAGDRFMEIIPANDGDIRAKAVLRSAGRGLPLILFSPRPSTVARKRRAPGTGVTVRLMGRNVFIQGAFIARMPNGAMHVVARGAYGGKGLGRASGRVFGRFIFGIDRLPINVLYTFGMAETLSNDQVEDAMLDRVEAAHASVIKREIAAVRRGF